MRQLLIFIVSSAVLMGLVMWGDRPEHPVPTWLYLLAAAPLVWIRISGTERRQQSPVAKGVAALYLLGTSIFLMLLGVVGFAMRDTWGPIMIPALPIGAATLVLAFVMIATSARR